VLRRTGFTGLDYELRDCEDEEFYSFSVMMSTAQPNPPIYHPNVVLVCASDSPPLDWLHSIQAELSAVIGTPLEIKTLNSVCAQGKTCIYLGDLNKVILADMDADQFAAVKEMATACEGLLWVTRGGSMESEEPEASISHGLLRSLRYEYRGKRYVTLDVSPQRSPWTPETAAAICDVFSAAFDSSSESLTRDWEYCERQGVIHVPRLFTTKTPNDYVGRSDAVFLEPTMEPLSTLNSQVRLRRGVLGGQDTPFFIEEVSRRPDDELPPGYLEVSPKAFGLNKHDPVATGVLDPLEGGASLEAYECSGVITRLSSEAANRGFNVGDRVCCLLFDGWTSRSRVHWSSAAKIPDDMTFEVAATLPASLGGAYISLHEVAKLGKGEAALIHSAGSEFGQAAIKLCRWIGADIYATVDTKRTRQLLMETLQIPEGNILSSQHVSFSSAIMEKTSGKGVDVVLNSLPGPDIQESFDCLGDFGRFVELGKADSGYHSRLSKATFRPNTAFHSVDLVAWASRRPEAVSGALNEVVHLAYEKLVAVPESITTYPISCLAEALSSMQTGLHRGKVVITVGDSDLVSVSVSQRGYNLAELKKDRQQI